MALCAGQSIESSFVGAKPGSYSFILKIHGLTKIIPSLSIGTILLKNRIIIASLLLILFTPMSFAINKQIAITIDDLPFVGEAKNFHLDRIITTLKEHDITATGFIIAGNIRPDNWPVLQKFKEAGLGLGNHTLTHANLNLLKPEAYIHEIDAADKILQPVLTEPKYFRYPYLATGSGEKKEKIKQFLTTKHYEVAPITVDSKDFVFNNILLGVPEKERRSYINSLKQAYIEFIWQQTKQAEERAHYPKKADQAQILLIHANLLNAYLLPDIINLYEQNGYTFVSLNDALKTIHKASQPKVKKVS
jgi:peptidoglycan/xylan/chitin deacetylase (PgdA/CDA1 family)